MRVPKATKVVCREGSDRWIRQEMRKRGLRVIGSGSFGVVFSGGKTSRRVVKTIRLEDNDAYMDYLTKVILPLQGKSTLVPKVYKLEVFDVEHESWCGPEIDRVMLITMERLQKFNVMKKLDRKKALFNDVRVHEFYDLAEALCGYDSFLLDTCATKVKTLARKLRRLLGKHNEDLYDGNVMWRKVYTNRPEIVITDPIA